jgi:hypothetical protein
MKRPGDGNEGDDDGNEFYRNDNGSERSTPTRGGRDTARVYTALYLALVGAIHFASSPDAAAAVALEGTRAPITVTAMPAEPSADTNDLSTTAPVVPDEPDNRARMHRRHR